MAAAVTTAAAAATAAAPRRDVQHCTEKEQAAADATAVAASDC